MADFEQGDIIRVPFPYTDREKRQHRPALVVSKGRLGEEHNLLWVVMITSAENRRWQSDVAIVNHARCGLPAPSIIRPAKIATVEVQNAEKIGKLPNSSLKTVMQRILALMS